MEVIFVYFKNCLQKNLLILCDVSKIKVRYFLQCHKKMHSEKLFKTLGLICVFRARPIFSSPFPFLAPATQATLGSEIFLF